MTSFALRHALASANRRRTMNNPNTQTGKEVPMNSQCEECGEKRLTESMLLKWGKHFCGFKCLEKWQIAELTKRGVLDRE